MDKFSNHIKNLMHGFFLSVGTTVAEPSTVLPLMVNHFGGGSIIVGIYSSLLRGGAVFIQLYAAFHAQEYPLMKPYLRKIFFMRFLAWFLIGLSIVLIGNNHHTATLIAIGIGLFVFSFSAGFGGIYFKEITAKIFTHKYRAKSMAWKQSIVAFGAIISGSIAGWVLHEYPAPYSYGYLFMLSAFIMGIGFLAMGMVDEPIKTNISTKEKSFKAFLKNANKTLRSDKTLQTQIIAFLFAYGYLLVLPFIILDAKSKIALDGMVIGTIITAQMVGSLLSNILWGKLSSRGDYKLTAIVSIIIMIAAVSLSIFANSVEYYLVLFFMIGMAIDGIKLSSDNLIIVVAPEDKRPIYMALQNNIVSLGLFFSIIGGIILKYSNFTALVVTTLLFLGVGLYFSFQLTEEPHNQGK
ncbi:MAG: MFS transporter [Campylobacterales bacterium]|nr:MFS transporter [Campylobacterales bacterium]